MSKQVLNDGWVVVKDSSNVGRQEHWFNAIHDGCVPAPVPGVFQQIFPDYQGVVWYYKKFNALFALKPLQRYILKFRAVDYLADVWINGKHIGQHEGGETPFSFDVTGFVDPCGENLVAVRVLCPDDDPIDGLTIGNTPCRNCRSSKNFAPGALLKVGGILQQVSLLVVNDKRLEEIYINSDCKTGKTHIELTCKNDTTKTVSAAIQAAISDKMGDVYDNVTLQVELPAGESVHKLSLNVNSPRLWGLEEPFLYTVTAMLKVDGSEDIKTKRTGYREFCVKDGYFHLNGKRLFLKSSHTANHFPIGQVVPINIEMMYQDLYYAKTAGFNMIRFIAGMPLEEQLDFCDEIGLMVYEENYAAWLLEDSPEMPQRFDSSLCEMILRDRSHPSVTAWGLLNETGGALFDKAVASLELLRNLDKHRLVFLHSSRGEGTPKIGSISNPGSDVWEYEWGEEGPDRNFEISPPDSLAPWGAPYYMGYAAGMGDVHIYPRVPQSPKTRELIKNLGRNTKPVLISEYGVGSMMNVVGEYHHFQQKGLSEKLHDMTWMKRLYDRLEADWKRFGMDEIYPVLEDMLVDSQKLHLRQREICFDLIRSNPKICGYNVTGLIDHAYTGEGLWDFWREFKPGAFDLLRKCHAALQWCLFVPDEHVYSGQEFTIEAVLANEDVLQPGEYPVVLHIIDPDGKIVWEKHTKAVVDASASFDSSWPVPVAKEKVKIFGRSGKYTFRAYMEDGGKPAGGRLAFYLTNPQTFPVLQGNIMIVGISKEIEEFLTHHGVICKQLNTDNIVSGDLVMIGDISDMNINTGVWKKLFDAIENGARAVFLCPASVGKLQPKDDSNPLRKVYNFDNILPIEEGCCSRSIDWLYHKECVNKSHPIFEGLGHGMMDFEYYGPVIPDYIIDTPQVADEVIAASFAVGYCPHPDGYASGVLVGKYNYGKGSYTISTMNILDNINRHPAADRLLINIVNYFMVTS